MSECTVETFMTLSLEQIDDEVMAKAATSAKAKCALGKEGKRGLSSAGAVSRPWQMASDWLHRPSVCPSAQWVITVANFVMGDKKILHHKLCFLSVC